MYFFEDVTTHHFRNLKLNAASVPSTLSSCVCLSVNNDYRKLRNGYGVGSDVNIDFKFYKNLSCSSPEETYRRAWMSCSRFHITCVMQWTHKNDWKDLWKWGRGGQMCHIPELWYNLITEDTWDTSLPLLLQHTGHSGKASWTSAQINLQHLPSYSSQPCEGPDQDSAKRC